MFAVRGPLRTVAAPWAERRPISGPLLRKPALAARVDIRDRVAARIDIRALAPAGRVEPTQGCCATSRPAVFGLGSPPATSVAPSCDQVTLKVSIAEIICLRLGEPRQRGRVEN